MEREELKSIVENVLLAADQPINASELCKIFLDGTGQEELRSILNELKDEWESNNCFKDSPEGLKTHEEKRASKMIKYTTEYWFDITSFFGIASINLDDKDNPFGINWDDIP